MSDIGTRADDYERRLARAGSTESIISGLIKGAERSRKTVRLLMISLIVDIVLSLGMAGLALVAWHNANVVERNTENIAHAVFVQCAAQNVAATSTNTVLETLMIGAGDPGVFTIKERNARIARYQKVKVPLLVCEKH